MLEGLRSPNIHTPLTLSEFSSIIQHYPTSSYWAGGTFIMSRNDYYPCNTANDEIIYLGSIEELHRFQRNDRVAEFGSMASLYDLIYTGRTILPKDTLHNRLPFFNTRYALSFRRLLRSKIHEEEKDALKVASPPLHL